MTREEQILSIAGKCSGRIFTRNEIYFAIPTSHRGSYDDFAHAFDDLVRQKKIIVSPPTVPTYYIPSSPPLRQDVVEP